MGLVPRSLLGVLGGSKIRSKVLDPSGMFETTLEDFTLHRVVTISHSAYAIRCRNEGRSPAFTAVLHSASCGNREPPSATNH